MVHHTFHPVSLATVIVALATASLACNSSSGGKVDGAGKDVATIFDQARRRLHPLQRGHLLADGGLPEQGALIPVLPRRGLHSTAEA